MSIKNLQSLQNRFFLYCFVVLLIAMLLSGCSFGPKQLKDGHLAYNETVRLSSDQELLLNIVRLRYLDTIEFMSISSISSQLSFSVSVGGSIDEDTSLGFADAAWSSRPTFTFTPQRGESFAKLFITPVPVDVLSGLAAADWDIPVLFQLLAQDVNGYENISGLISNEFLQFIKLLGDVQSRAELYFGTIEQRDEISGSISTEFVSGSDLIAAAKEGYRFELDPTGENYILTQTLSQPVLYIPKEVPERDQMLNLLHIRKLKNEYVELRPGKYPEETQEEIDFIMVEMRSIFDAISYLAGGVEVPEPHVAKGWATAVWPVLGAPSNDLRGLFQIHVSESRPDSLIAVQHRGYWFYLADNDTRSKLTFLTLAEILRMALSPSENAKTPVLTLPVGR